MQETISIEDAQAHLADIIAGLEPGKELIITKNERPVAKLIAQEMEVLQPRIPGSAVGKLIIHSDDDEHLRDFREYMP
jgi:antitoxin (DNA-binding transcriptional repressor) of toxin-antitoxin stability system